MSGRPQASERLPDLGRAGDAFEQTGLVDRLVLRRAGENRIVAVQDRLHVHVGPRHDVVGVVAHPFAERPFRLDLPGHGFAFDHDLGIGGNRKAGVRALDHFDRLAADAAGEVILRHAAGNGLAESKIEQRILAAHDRELAALAALEIFVAMNAAVFAFGDLAADGFAVVDFAAIGAEVVPVGVRILGDAHIGGADVAGVSRLVVDRHGELEHVDFVAFQDVVEYRPGLDHLAA